MRQPGIAVVGAGLIGRKHAALVAAHDRLAAVIDPADDAGDFAETLGVPWAQNLEAYLAEHHPEAVIVATPNQLHARHASLAIAAGCPVLIEKPVTDTAEAGAALVAEAADAGVPLLVGHHRRHNPLVGAAQEVIRSGRIGRIVTVQGQFWLMKPDDYFVPDWRRAPGAGPVFINLIHDIDLLRCLCGEIVRVTAVESRAVRGLDVEDTAAILLEFGNGALGTFSVSDTVSAPWSWEFTAGENPAYPMCQAASYAIGGTHGSLSVPDLTLWHHPGKRGWWEPMASERITVEAADPLVRQIKHFRDVIEGRASPIVSGEEGLNTLRVIEAVKRSAAEKRSVEIIY